METLGKKQDRPQGRDRRRRTFTAVLVVLLLGTFTTTGYFYNKYNQLKKDPNIEAKKATSTLTDKVAHHMELPDNEVPTVATVEDKDKLKDQAFFADAKNGDKLLIYTDAKKAIIYRPQEDRVINVGPVAMNSADTDTNAESDNSDVNP